MKIELCALLLATYSVVSQTPGPAAPEEPDPAAQNAASGEPPKHAQPIDDPYEAYDQGAYDQALREFVDQQVEKPQDPRLMMNIGASHYQMDNFDEARKAFEAAVLRGEEGLKARAHYNLGNVAYRQGQLKEAIEHYQTTLELDPNDQDAKFNLEFVRDEIRRRAEEAKNRQQQQQDNTSAGDPTEAQQPNREQQSQQEQSNQPEEDSKNQTHRDTSKQREQERGSANDSDNDGLSDEQERSAANPTDPENPDTDRDGLPDGEEDRNQNGQVDPGETDPNQRDSDGDGVPDGEDAEPAAGTAQATQQQDASAEGELNPAQLQRYLQALKESRPNRQRGRPVRAARGGKDW